MAGDTLGKALFQQHLRGGGAGGNGGGMHHHRQPGAAQPASGQPQGPQRPAHATSPLRRRSATSPANPTTSIAAPRISASA